MTRLTCLAPTLPQTMTWFFGLVYLRPSTFVDLDRPSLRHTIRRLATFSAMSRSHLCAYHYATFTYRRLTAFYFTSGVHAPYAYRLLFSSSRYSSTRQHLCQYLPFSTAMCLRLPSSLFLYGDNLYRARTSCHLPTLRRTARVCYTRVPSALPCLPYTLPTHRHHPRTAFNLLPHYSIPATPHSVHLFGFTCHPHLHTPQCV